MLAILIIGGFLWGLYKGDPSGIYHFGVPIVLFIGAVVKRYLEDSEKEEHD